MADEPHTESVANSHSAQPNFSVRFDRDPSAPRRMRAALRALIGDESDALSSSIELVASELVANVVLHTNDGGTVEARNGSAEPFRLEVSDDDPGNRRRDRSHNLVAGACRSSILYRNDGVLTPESTARPCGPNSTEQALTPAAHRLNSSIAVV